MRESGGGWVLGGSRERGGLGLGAELGESLCVCFS